MQDAERASGAFSWLLLAPALLLALPGLDLLHDDPFPLWAATGWCVLGLVPVVLVLATRRVSLGRAELVAGALLIYVVVASLRELPDPLQARRAACHVAALTAAFLAGARLDPRGRESLARGAMVLSVLLCGQALVRELVGGAEGFAGALGNSGSLSQAALPGAVAGAWLAATRRGGDALLGASAALLFCLHAGGAPVFAGILAWAAALLAGVLPRLRPEPRAALPMGAALASGLGVSLVAFLWLPPHGSETGAQVLAQETDASSDLPPGERPSSELGGVPVRGLVWRSAVSLWSDAAVLGVGPGQFQATFPPHRSVREMELSRHGVCDRTNTEVEHAHSDLLGGLVELGLLGGGLWLYLLGLCAHASWTAVRSREPHRAALGAAGIAALAGACMHAPLTANTPAAVCAFAILGTLVSRPSTPKGVAPRAPRWLGALVALGLLGLAWQATDLVRHGRAMADYLGATRELEAAAKTTSDARVLAGHASAAERALERALDAAPRSAEARLVAARIEPDPARRIQRWAEVLDVRPFSVEAHEGLGIAAARAEDPGLARDHLQTAFALAPSQPRILENLILLEVTQGDPERGRVWLDELRELPCDETDWITGFGATRVLEAADFEAGAWFLCGQPLAEATAETLHAQYKDEDGHETERVREGRECLAQLLWARQHVANGSYRLALRNYRQAQRMSLRWLEGGAVGLRLERAAVETLAGNGDTAFELLEPLRGRDDLAERGDALPAWAREALEPLLR